MACHVLHCLPSEHPTCHNILKDLTSITLKPGHKVL
jgi:hypothetical protein